jgi:hypothetical protein
MTRLSYLHEPGVLWNIKSRYMFDDIYTYTGSILIAVNPFAPLPHLYGPHMMDQYRGVDLGDLSPHVYAIADAAYRQMRKEMKGQSILVRVGLGCCCSAAELKTATTATAAVTAVATAAGAAVRACIQLNTLVTEQQHTPSSAVRLVLSIANH